VTAARGGKGSWPGSRPAGRAGRRWRPSALAQRTRVFSRSCRSTPARSPRRAPRRRSRRTRARASWGRWSGCPCGARPGRRSSPNTSAARSFPSRSSRKLRTASSRPPRSASGSAPAHLVVEPAVQGGNSRRVKVLQLVVVHRRAPSVGFMHRIRAYSHPTHGFGVLQRLPPDRSDPPRGKRDAGDGGHPRQEGRPGRGLEPALPAPPGLALGRKVPPEVTTRGGGARRRMRPTCGRRQGAGRPTAWQAIRTPFPDGGPHHEQLQHPGGEDAGPATSPVTPTGRSCGCCPRPPSPPGLLLGSRPELLLLAAGGWDGTSAATGCGQRFASGRGRCWRTGGRLPGPCLCAYAAAWSPCAQAILLATRCGSCAAPAWRSWTRRRASRATA
jgi:hypothetical protein